MEEAQGRITIAPGVLTTIVRQTTLEQRGVSRLAPVPPRMRNLFAPSSATDEGIFVKVTDEGVHAEVHLVAKSGINLLKLGESVQASVARAIEEMLGLSVATIDVYIDDVSLVNAAEEVEDH